MRWDVELWPRNPLEGAGWFRRPWYIPRPFWHRVSWIRAGYTAFLVFGYLLVWLLPLSFLLRLIAGYGGILVGGIVFVVCPRVVYTRMKAKLVENDYLLCLHCGYSLTGLPSDHACPECGTPYQAEALRRAWRCWVEKRRLPRDVIGQG